MTINGKPTGAAEYYLMSAVYAYYYLLGSPGRGSTNPYDPQSHIAADLYNRALGKGLATGKDGRLEVGNGVRELPVGRLTISLALSGFL